MTPAEVTRHRVAEYYRAAAAYFDVAQNIRPWRVTSVRWEPIDRPNSSPTNPTAHGTWVVETGDGQPPLRARSIVLATGTYGEPDVCVAMRWLFLSPFLERHARASEAPPLCAAAAGIKQELLEEDNGKYAES